MKNYIIVIALWFIVAAFLLGIKSELVEYIYKSKYVSTAFILFLVGLFLLIISSKMKRE